MVNITGRIILCFVLLWFHTLANGYGLSKDGANTNTKQTMHDKKASTKVEASSKVTIDQPPQGASKLELEIKELRQMHQRLSQEKVKGAGLTRKQKLLLHIENQIKLRQKKQNGMQMSTVQLNQQKPLQQPSLQTTAIQNTQPELQLTPQKPIQTQVMQTNSIQTEQPELPKTRHNQMQPQLMQAKSVRQLFNPAEPVPLPSGQQGNSVQNINQQPIIVQNHAQPNVIPSIQGTNVLHSAQGHAQSPNMPLNIQRHAQPQNVLSSVQGQIPVMGGNVIPNQAVQNQFVIPQGHNLVPHFSPQQSLQLNGQPIMGQAFQQFGQQGQILVPLSALTSGQILNGRGVGGSDRVIVVNSLPGRSANAGQDTALAKAKQQVQAPPAVKTAPPPPTKRPTTQKPTPPTTTPGIETTTPMDEESMKQTLLERTLKKQALEIRKLQLEIRALQRQEMNNFPEENEDGPQHHRQPNRRQMMFPFIR